MKSILSGIFAFVVVEILINSINTFTKDVQVGCGVGFLGGMLTIIAITIFINEYLND